jgi:hypothetical protein
MNIKKMLAGLLLAVVLTFPPAASAKDFTINVKVDLKDLHQDVQTVRIKCAIERDNQQILALGTEDNNVSSGGSLFKTVAVKVNVDPYNPADVSGYTCILQLSRDGTNFLFPGLPPDSNPAPPYNTCNSAENEWLCVKESTLYTLGFNGSIP